MERVRREVQTRQCSSSSTAVVRSNVGEELGAELIAEVRMAEMEAFKKHRIHEKVPIGECESSRSDAG